MDLLAFNRQIGNVYVRQGVFVLSSFAHSKVAELEPPHIFFLLYSGLSCLSSHIEPCYFRNDRHICPLLSE